MEAIILCGGFGVRFPMFPEKPKAMLEISGKPILAHLLEKIEAIEDIERTYISTNRKFSSDFLKWMKKNQPQNTELVIEDSIDNAHKFGAVGAIRFVLDSKKITGPFMVINGDNIFEDNLNGVVEDSKKHKCTSLGVYEVPNPEAAKLFGVVEMDASRKVTFFEEKPQKPKSRLVSTGIYVFPETAKKSIIEYLDSGMNPDEPGNFMQWLYRRETIRGSLLSGAWFDVGNKDSYQKAKNFFESSDVKKRNPSRT